jgi:hypothetical protein
MKTTSAHFVIRATPSRLIRLRATVATVEVRVAETKVSIVSLGKILYKSDGTLANKKKSHVVCEHFYELCYVSGDNPVALGRQVFPIFLCGGEVK